MLTLSPKPLLREVLLVVFMAVALSVLTALPWLNASRQQPPNTTYLGTNVPDILDSQVYYAFIQANADGNSLYRNTFTSETQPAVLFNPLWWTLGRIVDVTKLSPVTIFWVFKAVSTMVLVFLLHSVLLYYFSSPQWRLLALFLIVFGGGIGGLFLAGLPEFNGLVSVYQNTAITPTLPVDVTYSAGFVWSAALHSPLYVLSLTMLLIIGLAMWRSFTKVHWIHLAGVATLLLGLMHPYDLFIVFGVSVAVILFGIIGDVMSPSVVKTFLQRLLLLTSWALPPALYYGLIATLVPAIQEWNKQNILETSNLRTVVAGFTPMIFFVLIGVRYWWAERRKKLWIPLAWLSMGIGLMYLPLIQYQAKMIAGLSIPVGVLATAGLQKIWHKRERGYSWTRVLCILAISISVSTPIIFIQKILQTQKTESRYFYVDQSLEKTLSWIRTSTPKNSIVLGDVYTGNLVPQFARRATYLGHHHQTTNFQTKLQKVRDWFYQDSKNGAEKSEWLRREGIDYVIFGPYERLQGSFDPSSVPGLTKVYTSGTTMVFRYFDVLGE